MYICIDCIDCRLYCIVLYSVLYNLFSIFRLRIYITKTVVIYTLNILIYSHLHAFLYHQVPVYLLALLHPCSCVLVGILASWHPEILISSVSCVLVFILASAYPHVLRFPCIWLYPRILTSSCRIPRFVFAFLYPCTHKSSYPQGHVCLLVSLYPHILLSFILASCHLGILRFVRACLYIHIFISSGPLVHVVVHAD